jgi:hypothetical protein
MTIAYPPGYVVGIPQTLRERLRCAWFFLRYPGRIGIVYAPVGADAILNEVRATGKPSTREAINPIAAHRFYWRYSHTSCRSLWWNIRDNRISYWRYHFLNLKTILTNVFRR